MSVIEFSEGIPESIERRNRDETFIYPEEVLGKVCGGCMRCEEREGGWHCTMRSFRVSISPEHKACIDYWDKEEYDRAAKEHEAAVEKRREELWKIYAEEDPIKLPIVHDDYGRIPKCPICGEMPYSTRQCHWCGQRFIQDKEVTEYATPDEKPFICPNCGTEGVLSRSKYNGHKHFSCAKCGFAFTELLLNGVEHE